MAVALSDGLDGLWAPCSSMNLQETNLINAWQTSQTILAFSSFSFPIQRMELPDTELYWPSNPVVVYYDWLFGVPEIFHLGMEAEAPFKCSLNRYTIHGP